MVQVATALSEVTVNASMCCEIQKLVEDIKSSSSDFVI
jgi:hypothetical protein